MSNDNKSIQALAIAPVCLERVELDKHMVVLIWQVQPY